MSLQRTQRVAERLPTFYRSWDSGSLIYKLIDSFARSLDEQQRDIFMIARTHWVETAHLSDLDAMGALFDLKRGSGESDREYRLRVKNGVQQFRGGGTRESIATMVASFLKVKHDELSIAENPPIRLRATRSVTGDGEFSLGSMGVGDALPSIEISVETEGEKIIGPSLTVRETGAEVRFNGTILHGQRLLIDGRSAELDGKDVSERVERRGDPALLRSGSTWVFHEKLASLVGGYDRANFDSSVFQKPVPTVRIAFEWESRQPSTFELGVPRNALERSGKSPGDLEGLLNVIKAEGVKATLRIME